MNESYPAGPPPTGGGPAAALPVLTIVDAVKHYGGVYALKGVSLSVNAGEVHALVGENGAGKSTLVGVAAGRVIPDSGSVQVQGNTLKGRGPAEAQAAGVRLIPQELLMCPDMSVLDNILLGNPPVRAGLLDKRQARAEASARLARVGIDLDLDAPVGALSVVHRTFVQIARGLTPGAAVMLIDEPTAPMDNTEVETFLKVMRALTTEGIGIVYISHRLDEIFQLADRVSVMRDGNLVRQIDGSDLTHQTVIDAMVGERELKAPVGGHLSGNSEAALQVRGVSASGVRDISFELHRGELLAVYGISGSGRESLGSALIGAIRRESGTVATSRGILKRGNVADAVAKGIGYVPAERRTLGLDLDASIAANLTWANLRHLRHWGLVTKGVIERCADVWVRRLEIKTPNSAIPVGALSGGSQQKVLLARWLAADCQILILEEPTRGVDIATKSEIYHLLRELAESGTSVLVITSDIEEASIVAPRVLVMRDGAITTTLEHPTQAQLATAAQAIKDVA